MSGPAFDEALRRYDRAARRRARAGRVLIVLLILSAAISLAIMALQMIPR